MSWVTAWNQTGIRWREMSLTEVIWLVHTTTLQNLKEDRPQQVRLYLNQTKDYTSLREWDKSQLKDSRDK